MPICYFCGVIDENCIQCPKCLEYYCNLHTNSADHDCPLIPIENPYDVALNIEENNNSENESNMDLNSYHEPEHMEYSSDDNDDTEEIEVDIDGVYDIEHEYEDPDGYLKPVQIIDKKSEYTKKISITKNRELRCCFCSKPLGDEKSGIFFKCRNIDERTLKSMKRGLFGGKIDGFWICLEPECSIKWKSGSPVYLDFGGNKIYKYVDVSK